MNTSDITFESIPETQNPETISDTILVPETPNDDIIFISSSITPTTPFITRKIPDTFTVEPSPSSSSSFILKKKRNPHSITQSITPITHSIKKKTQKIPPQKICKHCGSEISESKRTHKNGLCNPGREWDDDL